MRPRPPFDRELLIPIAVGIVSILGVGWVFLTSNLREIFIPPTVEPTTIPSDLGYLKTEMAPALSASLTLEEMPATIIGTSPAVYSNPSAEALPSTSTMIAESPPAPSATSTPDQPPPLQAGKIYDDMDPNITYDRYWTVIKTGGTANAYKGALHVSESVGSEASFRFTGKQFYIGYQRGKNFGTVTVMIDNQSYSFHEQAFDLFWRSPQLSPGTHSVRIIHNSGESINLDYIETLD